MFSLRFPEIEIPRWAERYEYTRDETQLEDQRPAVQDSGKLTKTLLQEIAEWKSPRSAWRVHGNSAPFVEEVSAFALSAKDERARIEPLTLLDGVQWPTASVILHLYHRDPYPIMDFRALWSLSVEVPKQYDFALWWAYVTECRTIRNQTGVSMRTLDRALWQFSKEHQPSQSDPQSLPVPASSDGHRPQ